MQKLKLKGSAKKEVMKNINDILDTCTLINCAGFMTVRIAPPEPKRVNFLEGCEEGASPYVKIINGALELLLRSLAGQNVPHQKAVPYATSLLENVGVISNSDPLTPITTSTLLGKGFKVEDDNFLLEIGPLSNELTCSFIVGPAYDYNSDRFLSKFAVFEADYNSIMFTDKRNNHPYDVSPIVSKQVEDAEGNVLLLGLVQFEHLGTLTTNDKVTSITIALNDKEMVNFLKQHILPIIDKENKIRFIDVDFFKYGESISKDKYNQIIIDAISGDSKQDVKVEFEKDIQLFKIYRDKARIVRIAGFMDFIYFIQQCILQDICMYMLHIINDERYRLDDNITREFISKHIDFTSKKGFMRSLHKAKDITYIYENI